MDYDISRWLKDDLRLIHMSEADLNGILYHPRHGTLCRRLTKFLAESTLCNKEYPNVYAKEEHMEAVEELKSSECELKEAIKDIEIYVRENENKERELGYLKSRLDYMRNIEDLQRTSTVAMEEIANRFNLGLEKVARNMDEQQYLSNSDLKDLYSLPNELPNKSDAPIILRQISSVDEELNEIVQNVNTLHKFISKLIATISTDEGEVDKNQLQLRETEIQNLLALRVPEPEEIQSTDVCPEETELKEKNLILSKKVLELDQQVSELRDEHKARKCDIIRVHKEQLEKCLSDFTSLQEIENVTQERDLRSR